MSAQGVAIAVGSCRMQRMQLHSKSCGRCCFTTVRPSRRQTVLLRNRSQQHVRALPIDLGALDLDIPEIDGDLASIKRELGAEFDDHGVASTYGNARQAVAALEAGVVLVDRSHWGRLRLTGEGRATFLHNQSTNDFNRLQPGEGCDTVFVTATARTLDLATALVSANSIMLITSPNMKKSLMERLDKYIFPGDNVTVQDISDKCAMLSLIGPEADKVLQEIGGDAITIIGKPYGSHQLLKFKSGPVFVAVGGGLATSGYTLIADESIAGDLFALLASKGCVLMGESEWEIARVLEGRPAPGAELTEDYNPLEAGLCHAVSINKGCYIGQETIAKVASRDGVKQQLWGLDLSQAVAVGAAVQEQGGEGTKIGHVTSVAVTYDGRHRALAYLKTKDSTGKKRTLEGAKVSVGDVDATVVGIPFATRTLADDLQLDVQGPGADARIRAAEEERAAKEAAAAAEAAAKAERFRAMQERLAAWQAQQGGAYKSGPGSS